MGVIAPYAPQRRARSAPFAIRKILRSMTWVRMLDLRMWLDNDKVLHATRAYKEWIERAFFEFQTVPVIELGGVSAALAAAPS